MQLSRLPIVIVAYNRPQYLVRVLDSLKAQQHIELAHRKIVLFQDGARSLFSHGNTTDESLISENVRLFRSAFPGGIVFDSEVNLGVGLNIDRAERYVFEELDAPAAMFFEDDLVLSPCYIQVLEKLLQLAIEDDRIGYVSAFGNYRADKSLQIERKDRLRPLHLLWGFGLTQRHWRKCRPYVSQYLKIIEGCDYRNRDHDAIHKLTESWGVKPGDTAQDRIKSFVTALVGAVKLNTEPTYATYIGAQGNAFTPEMFERWGFVGNECFSEPLSLDFDLARVNFDPWHPSNNVWKIESSNVSQSASKPPSAAVEVKSSNMKSQPNGSLPMDLVMSEPEKSLFLSFLQCAQNYLEFGSGGSTIIASNTVSGHVWSVDSSVEWLEHVRQHASFKQEKATLHHVDIGTVGNWGWPEEKSKAQAFPNYSREVWKLCKDAVVDLFLVDGRFRVACFAEVMKRASANSIIMVHDYTNRPQYHTIERIARRVAVADTLAVFQPNGSRYDLIDALSESFKLDPN
ncbi:hypothetical protein C5688_18925 [Methylocystis sp. MitZ-2018]|nr:hypothetical protein C5688_18925 [Methylocystis sp. MitZ-2018]